MAEKHGTFANSVPSASIRFQAECRMNKRLALITDAWHPQVNGVVRTLGHVCDGLRSRGHQVTVISPQDYRSFPCPTYPEIRLAFTTRRNLEKRLHQLQPTNIHIATEGPLGVQARRICLRNGWQFSTSFHTRFPEYLRERLPVPLSWSYAFLRRFHSAASACLVPTISIHNILRDNGFMNTKVWTRGVDRKLFRPIEGVDLGLPKPVFICVGRVAPEKNLDAFLSLDLPGTKLIVGDGPDLERLKRAYPDAVFFGKQTGETLARSFAGSDVFVFPSLTDTFGLVLLEAIASGLPVAAFPVPGPLDVISGTGAGVLSSDLQQAAIDALAIGRIDPDKHLSSYTWDACTDIFAATLVPMDQNAIASGNLSGIVAA
jgi:glycosyltransferase involved in cell wall biosynthesis